MVKIKNVLFLRLKNKTLACLGKKSFFNGEIPYSLMVGDIDYV